MIGITKYAVGMKKMLDVGAANIAQDEKTNVVWGMSGAVYQIGAMESLHPLAKIASQLMAPVRAPSAGRGARAVGT